MTNSSAHVTAHTKLGTPSSPALVFTPRPQIPARQGWWKNLARALTLQAKLSRTQPACSFTAGKVFGTPGPATKLSFSIFLNLGLPQLRNLKEGRNWGMAHPV